MDDIKVLISYHKKCKMLKSEYMIPIQVGAAKAKVDLGILRDDEGDNISAKNDIYSELTAQYWAWKNLKADYYGFMHYRRHFNFGDKFFCFDMGGLVHFKNLDDDYIEKIGLKDENIKKTVDGYDLVLPYVTDTASWGSLSNEVQFSTLDNLHAKDFDLVCNKVKTLYPEYVEAVAEFRKGHYAFWYNMFIMKKELFFDYCSWMFSIMFSAEKEIDFSEYNAQEKRTLAFMAERLFSIYLIHLQKKRDVKIKYLQVTFLLNTDIFPSKNETSKNRVNADYVEENYAKAVKKSYQELLDIGIPMDFSGIVNKYQEEWNLIRNSSKVVFYGAGLWCEQLLEFLSELKMELPVEIWDQKAEEKDALFGIPVVLPKFDKLSEYDRDILYVITIQHKGISGEVKETFFRHGDVKLLENRVYANFLAYELWKKMAAE